MSRPVRKFIRVEDVTSAVGTAQRALDSHDYQTVNAIRDVLVRKFLQESVGGNSSKLDMSEMASLILNIDNQAPFKPLGA